MMAQAYGADARLVGFMQYLRVIFVAGIAAIVARTVAGITATTPAHAFFEAPDLVPALTAAAIAIGGSVLGKATRLPARPSPRSALTRRRAPCGRCRLLCAGARAGARLCPARLDDRPRLRPRRPPARRAGAFPGDPLHSAAHRLFGLLAYALHVFAGIDPLTAYLATSPGGMDSIAIIAAAIDVDVPFIMALQTARMLIVMAIGPALARRLANRLIRRNSSSGRWLSRNGHFEIEQPADIAAHEGDDVDGERST